MSSESPSEGVSHAIELAKIVAEALSIDPTIGELSVEYHGIKVTLKRDADAQGKCVPPVAGREVGSGGD